MYLGSAVPLFDRFWRRWRLIRNGYRAGGGHYKTFGMGGTRYGATKAALERFTQGLAQEVYRSRDLGNLPIAKPGTVHPSW